MFLSIGLLAASTTCFGQDQDKMRLLSARSVSVEVNSWLNWFKKISSDANKTMLARQEETILALQEETYINNITQDIQDINDLDKQLAESQSKLESASIKAALVTHLQSLQDDKEALCSWVDYNRNELSNQQLERADTAIEAADSALKDHGWS